MKECDILGGQNILTPLTYFRGSRPKPPGSTPLFLDHDEIDCRRRRCRRCGR